MRLGAKPPSRSFQHRRQCHPLSPGRCHSMPPSNLHAMLPVLSALPQRCSCGPCPLQGCRTPPASPPALQCALLPVWGLWGCSCTHLWVCTHLWALPGQSRTGPKHLHSAGGSQVIPVPGGRLSPLPAAGKGPLGLGLQAPPSPREGPSPPGEWAGCAGRMAHPEKGWGRWGRPRAWPSAAGASRWPSGGEGAAGAPQIRPVFGRKRPPGGLFQGGFPAGTGRCAGHPPGAALTRPRVGDRGGPSPLACSPPEGGLRLSPRQPKLRKPSQRAGIPAPCVAHPVGRWLRPRPPARPLGCRPPPPPSPPGLCPCRLGRPSRRTPPGRTPRRRTRTPWCPRTTSGAAPSPRGSGR